MLGMFGPELGSAQWLISQGGLLLHAMGWILIGFSLWSEVGAGRQALPLR